MNETHKQSYHMPKFNSDKLDLNITQVVSCWDIKVMICMYLFL